MSVVRIRNRLVYSAAAGAILLFMLPGQPGYVPAVSLPFFIEQAEENGVTLNSQRLTSLNRLALVLDRRSDLQALYGRERTANPRGMLRWVRGYPDSEAETLRKFDQQFAAIEQQWDSPENI